MKKLYIRISINLKNLSLFKFVFIFSILLGSFLFFGSAAANASDSLVQQSDLVYQGAFRVPQGGSGSNESFQHGGYTITYNGIGDSNAMCTASASPYACCTGAGIGTCSGGGSLFMVGNNTETYPSGYVGEISIPTPVCLDSSSNAVSCTGYSMPSTPVSTLTNLNTASLIQGFVDDTYGAQNTISSPVYDTSGSGLLNTGFLVYNGKLIGDTKAYYDAAYKQEYSHFTNNLNLSLNNFSGYYELNTGLFAGYSPGPMTAIPSAYQAQLGGKVLTGQGPGTGIVTSLSYGPAAIAFDPANLISSNLPPSTIPATALAYYNSSHYLPGGYWASDQASNIYTSPSDQIYGTVFPDNTRSVLFFGKHGLANTDGHSCYGEGTSNLSAAYSDGCPGGAGTCQYANRLAGYGGSVTSGTFINGETVTQAGTSAMGTLIRVDIGGTGDLEFLKSAKPTGANITGVWTGQTSGATFTPQSGRDLGDEICYDPASGPGGKGNHSYPYVNYVWAYDVGDASGNNTSGNTVSSLSSVNPGNNNLTAVKLGLIQPYEVVPYATWTFSLPTEATSLNPGNFRGAAWDPVNRLLYVTQSDADKTVYSAFPLVHVYKLSGTTTDLDTTPPTISSFSLPSTTTSLTVSVSSLTATDNIGVTGYLLNESASTPSLADPDWSAVPPASYVFSSAGAKTLYAWAKDAAGNISQSASANVIITIPDTTPPTLSNGSPASTLTSGTTQTTLSVTTDENATCKYSTTPNTDYSSMAKTFTTTGGTSHSTTITGLSDGNSYTYYVRCEDSANNANATDYKISFSVALALSTAVSSDTAADTATATTTDNDATPDIFKSTEIQLGNSWYSTNHRLTTNDDSLKLKGQNSDVSKIKVYKGKSLFKTITADLNGAWDSILKFKDDFFHTIRIKQYDQANNLVSTNSFKLRLDTAKPKFKETIPSQLDIARNDKITFTATDDNSGMDHYEVKLYPAKNYWREQQDDFYQIPQDVSNGTYDLYIRAYDKAGNYAEELIHVTVADRLPITTNRQAAIKTTKSIVKTTTLRQAPITNQTTNANAVSVVQQTNPQPQVQNTKPETQTQTSNQQTQPKKSNFVWWKPWTWWWE